MLIGYMRVSTAEQSLDLQRDALEKAGCRKIYEDVCSGRATERPGLAQALDTAREGDTLVIWKLDRIGRSLPHVVGLVGELQKQGIGLKVLTGDVDTTTATGRLVFGIFATLAEFERDLIHERTMAGLAAARARGARGGTAADDDPSEA
jgi:DNA invertase Pin-like site-specific DNA recombinase